MSDLKELINREIQRSANQGRIRGKILSQPTPLNFDLTGATDFLYVCDVDVGAEVPLRNVPVKINGPKARFYAQIGSPVYLDRNAQGRYQVVAPADRGPAQGSLTLLDEDAEAFEAGGNVGLSLRTEVFDWYKGDTPEALFFDPATDPDTLLWLRSYDRSLGLPINIVPDTDTDGALVTALEGKAPTTNDAVSNGNPGVYRRFDPGNPNTLSSLDLDGVDDGYDLQSAVVESSAGQISIFILCNKDVVSAGDDVVLELGNWRVLSRRSAGDTWGFNNGGGILDSGATIGIGFTLIEVIASAYNNVNLYQDGTLLGNFTTAAGGLLLGTSSLGYSAAAVGGTHNGRVLEVLVIDRTVTTADRQAIEGYFDRWLNVTFARWGNNVDGFPKITILDAQGNPI